MNIEQLSENLKSYISIQIDNMGDRVPLVKFMKPLITRALDKNFSKVTKALDLIADKDGNVDTENILSEMIDNVNSMEPFNLNTSFIGELEIGGGEIKLNIPLIDKRMVLNTEDLNMFKEMIINK